MPTESAFANSVLEANTRKTIEVNMILVLQLTLSGAVSQSCSG